MSNVFGENFDYGNSPLYKDDGEVTQPGVAEGDDDKFEGDIKLFLTKGVSSTADVVMGDREIIREPGLETAVILSLFTDRRAEADDIVPDGTDDRRGWWADALGEVDDVDGSRLWLDTRMKALPATTVSIEGHVQEALQWMIEDGVAKEVNVVVARISAVEINIQVSIVRPDGTTERFRYSQNWNKQLFGKDG